MPSYPLLLVHSYLFSIVGIITTQSKQIKASSPLTFRQTLLHFSIGMSRWNSSEHLPKTSPWLLLSGSVLVPQCRVLNPINFTQHSGDCLKFLENDTSSNIEYCSSGALGQNHNAGRKDKAGLEVHQDKVGSLFFNKFYWTFLPGIISGMSREHFLGRMST